MINKVAPLLFLTFFIVMCGRTEETMNIRKCSGAGKWFADTKKSLTEQVDAYLNEVESQYADKEIRAIIVPHAGYRFSGKASAAAYKNIVKKKYKRIIILGINHTAYLNSASIMKVDAFETPLGIIPLDKKVCQRLLIEKYFTSDDEAQIKEHSIENQLPFLQRVLGSEFEIVPILIGDLPLDGISSVANSLKPFYDKNTLIVVSSDFTHYGQLYEYVPFKENIKENLQALDTEAINLLIKKDLNGFINFLSRTNDTICGRNALLILLNLLAENTEGHLTIYYTSGDLTGDYSLSVSYVSIIYTK